MSTGAGAFIWGLIFGASLAIIALGHNGVLTECAVAHPVSQRLVHSPGGCEVDLPSFAKVCHYLDASGNHIITTSF